MLHEELRAAFQQLEVDYFLGNPNRVVHRTDLLETPIVRMYGVTKEGPYTGCASSCS